MIDMLKAYGWKGAYRNMGSGAFGGGDIIGGPQDLHIECKWHERADIWNWLRQAEGEARPTDIASVFCKCNRLDWFAVLPQDEWVALHAMDPKPLASVVIEPGQRLSLWKAINAALDLAAGLMVPQVVFQRAGSQRYSVVPAQELLRLLAVREWGMV